MKDDIEYLYVGGDSKPSLGDLLPRFLVQENTLCYGFK